MATIDGNREERNADVEARLEALLEIERQRQSRHLSPNIILAATNHQTANENPQHAPKRRHRIKGRALQILESFFARNTRPTHNEIVNLAALTKEEEHRIRVWFNNRRGKLKSPDYNNQPCILRQGEPVISNGEDKENYENSGNRQSSQNLMLQSQQIENLRFETLDKETFEAMKRELIRLKEQRERSTVKLPPISKFLGPSDADFDLVKAHFHRLFTLISKFKFTSAGTQQLQIFIKQGTDSIIRVFKHFEIPRRESQYYVLTGPQLCQMGLLESPVLELNAWDDQFLVRVDGVCVIMTADGGGYWLRAACIVTHSTSAH